MRDFLTRRRLWVGVTLLIIVIGLIAVWRIQQVYLREFDPNGRLTGFAPAEVKLTGPQFVQILDLSCPCNGFSREHISSLVASANRTGRINSEIWVLDNGQADGQRLKAIAAANDLPESAIRRIKAQDYPWIPATPAALLSNVDGSVAYFGPFSSGIRCNTGNSFIDAIVHRIESDDHVFTQVNAIVDGCFCPWPETAG